MKKVLIVDDNKDILAIVQLVLETRGFEVMTIWRGEETIQAVKDFSPNVVLLDIYLGTTNGINICKDIKSNPDTQHSCVIMFSAHGKSEEVLRECPADGFIAKPFDVHQLVQSIEAEMGKCN